MMHSDSDQIVASWLDFMASKPLSELAMLCNPQAVAADAIDKRVLNWIRDHQRLIPYVPAFEVGHAPMPELQVENQQDVMEVMSMLPESDAELLCLCKAWGYSLEEAAQKLNISVEVAKKRLSRAMIFLNPEGRARDARSLSQRILDCLNRKGRKK
jgi:predicted DNA-binding protein (UPF0251 family)